MNLTSNNRGIALLLVLSSIVVLTTAIVQFAYTEHINYQLAVNAKERLQAYYLARSAVQFSKVMLMAQKQAETEKAKFGEAAEGYDFEPIYKRYPLSSELMKQAISGELNQLLDPSAEEEGGDEAVDAEEEEAKEDRPIGDIMDMDKGATVVSDEAKEFTNFTGEFLSEISEENAKYDLNKVASLVSTSPAYDQRKKLLQSLLMQEKYKDYFENQSQDSETLVHALADWVDQNDTINEYENIQRGSEDSGYDKNYPVKNGKMLTLSEVRLVNGMNDDILSGLKDMVTIYSGSDKINVCINTETGEEWIKAMIYHYTHNAGCGRAVDYDDEEKMAELVELVLGFCPDTAAMAQALNGELGLVEATSADTTSTTDSSKSSSTDKSSKSTASTASSSAKVAGCTFQFKDLKEETNNVFSIKATGMVGDTQLSISTVINTSNSDPTKWTYNYYHIE